MLKRIVKILNNYPYLKLMLKRLYFNIWEINIYIKTKFYRNAESSNNIIYVNPRLIERVGIGWGYYNRIKEYGKVKGGDWDLNTMKFEDLDVFQAFYDRYVLGKKWEDTSYFSIIKDAVLNKKKPWSIENLSDLESRMKGIDLLYKDIKEDGYKTQEQLNKTKTLKIYDEITIRIGRNGELLFENGRHRLSIAKILGLSQIPVLVTWRHKEWNKFKFSYNKFIEKRGYSYQKIDHIDLNNTKIARDDSRLNIIRKHTKTKGSLLDIGANLGYFCHKFEDDGFRCFAVERNYNNFYFLNKYKNIANRKFTAINLNFWEFKEKNHFDVVLALSIFHWCLKDAISFKKMETYLKNLKAKMIFFEPHLPDEAQMIGAYKNLNNLEFVKFICEKTGLSKWECIGKSENGRPLYKIW